MVSNNHVDMALSHLGFDDEAEGVCPGATGAAVVSGDAAGAAVVSGGAAGAAVVSGGVAGAASFSSPCETAQPQYRSLMKFVGTVNPFRMQLYLFRCRHTRL